MPAPWEKGFWTSGKGTDIWDIGTLGLSSEGGKKFLGNAWNDVTGVTGARAARDAARIQKDATDEAMGQFERIYGQNREDMMPWLESGKRSLSTLEQLMGSGGFRADVPEFGTFQGGQYTPAQMPGEFEFGLDDFEQDPGAKYRLDESERALSRAAAKMGGFASGATLKGLMGNAGEMASQEFGNAYGRARDTYGVNLGRAQNIRDFGRGMFESDRGFDYGQGLDTYQMEQGQLNDFYNRLANMAGMGQTQSQSLGGLGQNYGSNAADMITGGANAQAAGIVGGANARMMGTNNLLRLLMQGGGMAAGAF